jgi:hypothetical protein
MNTTNRVRFVFSGCKDNFLKYKNQYFFYKKTASFCETCKSNIKKDKKVYKSKNHHVRRDGFI